MAAQPDPETTLPPMPRPDARDGRVAGPAPGPQPARQAPESGLYAVLGVHPGVSDGAIQVAYRRQAARLARSPGTRPHALRQLNRAYEVLGNPTRRAEYDRAAVAARPAARRPAPPVPVKKGPGPVAPRRRPRRGVGARSGGLADLLALVVVIGLSTAAAALVLPRASPNLGGLGAALASLPFVGSGRRVAFDAPPASSPAPTAAAAEPGTLVSPADRFAGSTVSVSDSNPARNSPVSLVARLRRDGQPAANVDVWSTVQYRAARERWPSSGAIRTDANGTATITFNVGDVTPGYPAEAQVWAEVDGQRLSWSTSFTPR